MPITSDDYEKLGVFYLGKEYDLDARQVRESPILYDSKDLTTHAVCVGMTGSGKTGLCLALLEEAAIDGIPAICIDPKGDLGNLMLTFPDLKPADFRPWVDPAEATRKGLSPDDFARSTAEMWKKGLAEWGQTPDRIARLRDAAEVAIYTPGSTAGIPLSVLKSFDVPSAETLSNNEALRGQLTSAVSGLLTLLGIDADPLRSREHILLSNLLDRAWRAGRSLDIAALIREIQAPPFERVGVLDLESFYPAKDRFGLSMALNNLLGSPGFAAWTEGEPLDIQRLLYTAEGKPRLSIISIAHLSDGERMFFVTLLLNAMLSWMRTQSGTSSLRALLYMDEVFGYFPPVANPPSKLPMLTLLKQARAFGLGCVLATQNPVDLDYKGLANTGTWFLGRLQTERDKARVLDGLEGAAATTGSTFDRARMETILSGLGTRVFLMNNVHDDGPVVFQSRWALSYLRGPLTRGQIEEVMRGRKPELIPNAGMATVQSAGEPGDKPILPPDVSESYIPCRKSPTSSQTLVYRPALFATTRVHFVQARDGIDEWENQAYIALVEGEPDDSVWDEATPHAEGELELESSGESKALYASLPPALSRSKTLATLSSALKDFLYRSETLAVHRCAELKQVSKPGESEGDFRARLVHLLKESRDLEVEKLRVKYAPKLTSLQDQVRRAEQRLEREKSQVTAKSFDTVISMGSSVLGALFGRKLTSAANVTRAATTIRSASKIAKERAEAGQASDTLEVLKERLEDLNTQSKAEIEALQESVTPASLALTSVEVKPRKSDINITRIGLLWVPFCRGADGTMEPAASL